MKTIVIAGASGTIGTALEKYLLEKGNSVKRLVRRSESNESEIFWDPKNNKLDPKRLTGIDAIVNLAGVGIGDKKWSQKRMDQILQSRIKATELLSETLSGLKSDNGPAVLINASAIGYYGSTGTTHITEETKQGEGFLALVCSEWEKSTREAEKAGIRVAHARTGVVLSSSGGLLKRLLPLFKLGIGGQIGSGKQMMSWISLRDEVSAISWMLEKEIEGAVNLVSPEPVSNLEFTKTLGTLLKRPTILKVPTAALNLLYGKQLVEELMLSSQSVFPKKLLDNNFSFSDASLKDALSYQI
ncbi:MAG TPA: TIGR01777 family oxidoreductase, partial [Acidimicrobiales bacterium]|nr:TIGR01777 family oxidoreductase [Acidimicrobiales bacterium]